MAIYSVRCDMVVNSAFMTLPPIPGPQVCFLRFMIEGQTIVQFDYDPYNAPFLWLTTPAGSTNFNLSQVYAIRADMDPAGPLSIDVYVDGGPEGSIAVGGALASITASVQHAISGGGLGQSVSLDADMDNNQLFIDGIERVADTDVWSGASLANWPALPPPHDTFSNAEAGGVYHGADSISGGAISAKDTIRLRDYVVTVIETKVVSMIETPAKELRIAYDDVADPGTISGRDFVPGTSQTVDYDIIDPGTYPSTFLDEDGAQIVVYEDSNIIKMLRRTGTDWSGLSPTALFAGERPVSAPYPGGMVVAYWGSGYIDSGVYITWGTGHGTTYEWSEPFLLAAVAEQRPALTVASDLSIHVAYRTSATVVEIKSSRDGGSTWSASAIAALNNTDVTLAFTRDRHTDLVGVLRVDDAGVLTWIELQWTGSLAEASGESTIDSLVATGAFADGLQTEDGYFHSAYHDSDDSIKTKMSADQGMTWT